MKRSRECTHDLNVKREALRISICLPSKSVSPFPCIQIFAPEWAGGAVFDPSLLQPTAMNITPLYTVSFHSSRQGSVRILRF